MYSRNKAKKGRERNINLSCVKKREKHDGTLKICPSKLFFWKLYSLNYRLSVFELISTARKIRDA